IEREREVVRAGDLVLREPAAVEPGVTRLAAGEEPAIAQHRIRGRYLGTPPGLVVRLLVDDRLDRLRLAVADVAQQHAFGRGARRTHPYDRRLAEPLDVQVGAVVMGLRERGGARRIGQLCRAHPLTAPCVRPLTIHFCSDMNSAAAGIAASSVPAAN